VEFLSRREILTRYGAGGITESPGRITDDTQMTLFTAEGLLRGWVRGRHKGITSYEGWTAAAYLRWLATQGIRHPQLDESGWLFGQRALHSRRDQQQGCEDASRGRPRSARFDAALGPGRLSGPLPPASFPARGLAWDP
jgi:hypothetical protein